jgi:hypothetical protein
LLLSKQWFDIRSKEHCFSPSNGLTLEAKNIAFLQAKKIASLHDTIALMLSTMAPSIHGSFPKHHHHKENSVTWNMRTSAKE